MEGTHSFQKREKSEEEIAAEELEKELQGIQQMHPDTLSAMVIRSQLRSADALEDIADCLTALVDEMRAIK